MNPSGPKNLMPLSAIGLCDALIMTPAAAPSATRHAGDGGRRHDAERRRRRARPRSCRRRSPPRASFRRAACRGRRSPADAGRSSPRARVAPARPMRNASSGVSDSLATPRTPSVPKRRLTFGLASLATVTKRICTRTRSGATSSPATSRAGRVDGDRPHHLVDVLRPRPAAATSTRTAATCAEQRRSGRARSPRRRRWTSFRPRCRPAAFPT